MKTIFILSFVIALALCSCTSTGERSQLKEEMKEAAGVTETDWVERRRETITIAKEKVEDIRKDSQRIKKAGDKMSGTPKLRSQFEEKMSLTQKSLADVEKSLGNLEKTKAEDWEREHQNFVSKMNVLESHFHELRSMVK